MKATKEQIDAMIANTGRPQVWYDKVNELIDNGFVFKSETAEWINTTTGERGRICFTADRAWLRHPSTSATIAKAYGFKPISEWKP